MAIPIPQLPSCVKSEAPRTLKVRLKKDAILPNSILELSAWLQEPTQTIYNRIEFKFGELYYVIAKLGTDSE